ncbi:MAG: type VI secretion system contractile sheath large subunit [Myxococcales bacterium]|nr:type VI secretion system contractile sheath large subunit [Myxococcales bacterium]
MAATTELTTSKLARLQQSFDNRASAEEHGKAQKLLISDKFSKLGETRDQEDANIRFVNALAALVHNYPETVASEFADAEPTKQRYDKGKVQVLLSQIDALLAGQINEILHHPKFQELESVWRGLEDLTSHTNFGANICIDMLNASKEDLREDFENNSSSIFNSAFFNKVYIQEYDQYGGRPFGVLIGLYEFANTPDDIAWLQSMGKIANAAHAPFLAAVSPQFFGYEKAEQVEAVKDLRTLLSAPRFGRWHKFRDTDAAAYIGLTFPRYVVRLPWHPETNPCRTLNFTEDSYGTKEKYLWGNTAILMARNLARSFETSGWCQYLRGPRGGGLVDGLAVDTYPVRGKATGPDIIPTTETRLPVEICIPDYRELEFAESGFIPLIYRKETAEAAFFSTQSIKLAHRFKDRNDAENASLVTNLAYTFSVTRIAHYIKSIMRDNIGTTADAAYVQRTIDSWLGQYVTTVIDPDNLTLRYYPFKAVSVEVKARTGEIGWYDCTVAVLPHIQFEGMNVELRLESRLGSKA